MSYDQIQKNNSQQENNSQYLEQVGNYYNQMNPLILKHLGNTYQVGLLRETDDDDPYLASNLYFASQMGIKPGYYALDGCCGVCGPSIDIAHNFEGVRIEAINVSSAQVSTAKELIQQAELTSQIQVQVGDYHYLPFADCVFDLVFFLEGIGYSYDPQRLFAEAYRVLRPGGSLYIKDAFRKEPPLSNQEQRELSQFNQIHVHKTPQMTKTEEVILNPIDKRSLK